MHQLGYKLHVIVLLKTQVMYLRWGLGGSVTGANVAIIDIRERRALR